MAAVGGTGGDQLAVLQSQSGTVGGQAGLQTTGQTAGQVTAVGGGGQKQDLGLIFLDQLLQHLAVGAGVVVLQVLIVADIDLIRTIGKGFLGLGLDREKVGDLLVADGCCDVLALEEVADFLVFHMEQAGRVKLKCSPLPLDRLEPPAVETRTIRDTVSSLRLDAVAASGFSLSRGKAADLIASGRVQLNHRECVKPDHAVAQGDVLSCRGLGKCVLTEVGGPSKKGRILIVLERYV